MPLGRRLSREILAALLGDAPAALQHTGGGLANRRLRRFGTVVPPPAGLAPTEEVRDEVGVTVRPDRAHRIAMRSAALALDRVPEGLQRRWVACRPLRRTQQDGLKHVEVAHRP